MHYLQKLIADAQQHCSTRTTPNVGGWQLTTLLTLFAGKNSVLLAARNGGGNGGQEDEPQRHFEMLMKLPFKAEAAE